MTNTELYAIAKKHIGEGGAKARAYCGMSGGAWCNAYVCYIANEGGVKNLYFNGTKQTYCPTSIKWCNANLAMIPPYLAMPMDIIYFDWQPNGNPDHIGFVKSKNSSESIYTHEGNTNGGVVAEKERTVGYVQGIYRPHFKPSEADKKAELTCDGDFGWQSIYALQRALKLTADGILGKDTVKALQKKAGVAADGQWGKGTSKAVQKMVGTTVDGAFGKNSVIALQKWINKQNGSISEPTETKNEPTIEPTPSKKGYTGTFPTLPYALEKEAVKLAYAYKTAKSTYLYKGGKPKAAYKTALNKVYPNRSGWGAKSKAGASCDVFLGTCTRSSGENSDMPRGLSGQKSFLPKHFTKIGKAVSGAILYRANHVAIAVSLKGIMYQLNAHHDSMGGTYGMTQKGLSNFTAYYLPHKVSYFSKGDTFTEVKYLQAFLNWFGGYGLALDCDFGDATDKAVKDFQSKNGLTVDGQFGKACLAKAKEIKK